MSAFLVVSATYTPTAIVPITEITGHIWKSLSLHWWRLTLLFYEIKADKPFNAFL